MTHRIAYISSVMTKLEMAKVKSICICVKMFCHLIWESFCLNTVCQCSSFSNYQRSKWQKKTQLQMDFFAISTFTIIDEIAFGKARVRWHLERLLKLILSFTIHTSILMVVWIFSLQPRLPKMAQDWIFILEMCL